jgi:hypothetical protein
MHRALMVAAAVFGFGCPNAIAAEEPHFPFVISYDAPNNATNVATWLPSEPAGKHGFVQNRDGHLATDAGPIRFWGTNLAYEACFPTDEQAERVAARLARLGINCVRMHLMDEYTIWRHGPQGRILDPQKLEQLDFLIWQLKLHGIYTNVNLHVGRWFDDVAGFPSHQKRPQYDKGIDMFEPRMIQLQKDYARDLLTHFNRHTKTIYADEPCVAFVEISNEDSLLGAWQWGQLDSLAEPFASTLRKRWNAWLRKKYGDTDRLRKAWTVGETTPGNEILRNTDFSSSLDDTWQLQRDNQTEARLSTEAAGPERQQRLLKLVVTRQGQTSLCPTLDQRGLTLRKDATYTLTCRLRADAVRHCEVLCGMAHEPWEVFGEAVPLEVIPQWREHRVRFCVNRNDANGRIAFSHFEPGTYELTNISLRQGGIVGLEPDQHLENDSVPVLSYTRHAPASRDFCDFLWETERQYWQDMDHYLKNELHVKALVSGTQLMCSPAHIQAGLDYLDNHAYWQHPVFPEGKWSGTNWHLDDVAMVNYPGGTLSRLALVRVAGKPYTVSEYNHSAPNSYAAEGFPMIAAFAAFQDWNGVFSFVYGADRRFELRKIESFFNLKSHTAQLAHMPACAAMFLRRDVAQAKQVAMRSLSLEEERRKLYAGITPWEITADKAASDPRYSLIHATAFDLGNTRLSHVERGAREKGSLSEDSQKLLTPDRANRYVSDTSDICWDVTQKDAGYFTINTRQTKLFTGFVRGRTFPLGNVTLKIGRTRLDWATVSITAIDGAGFDQPGRILIAATGWTQNQDAKIEHLDGARITLRNRWGQPPVLCEGIPASITLPVPAARVQCYPLDESGNRRATIPVGSGEGQAHVELGPQHKTVWYEAEIAPSR